MRPAVHGHGQLADAHRDGRRVRGHARKPARLRHERFQKRRPALLRAEQEGAEQMKDECAGVPIAECI